MKSLFKKYWGLLIVMLVIAGWWLNGYADKETVECGHLMALAVIYPYDAPVETLDAKLRQMEDVLDREREIGTHKLANEYRELFSWGWFPPKEVRLLRDKFILEMKLEEALEEAGK